MVNPGRIAFEHYVDDCITKGKCPSCNGKISRSIDVATKDKISICGKCGYTKLNKLK